MSWSVRVHGGGRIAGAGVLLSGGYVLTCAHVVNAALGRPDDTADFPEQDVELQFPGLAGAGVRHARVVSGGWHPIEADQRGDIAVLHLTGGAPEDAAPAVLRARTDRYTPVHAYGYPAGYDQGVEAQAVLAGPSPDTGWVQLEARGQTGHRIAPGFSGAAVVADSDGSVLGIVVLADRDKAVKVAWMLPVNVIAARLPPALAQLVRVADAGPARREVRRIPAVPAEYLERRDDQERIVELLTRPARKVVGLVGMPGAGKSMLARAVVHDARIATRFPDVIVWLEIGPEPDVVTRLGLLAEALGDPRPVTDAAVARARLGEQLRGRRCLLVLDDVWELETLRDLALESEEITVLVTTRSRDVLFTGADVHDVGGVSPEQSRAVLARYAGTAVEDLPPEADEVAASTGHLMLALAILGGMVAEGRSWARVLERLRRADLGNLRGRFPDYRYESLLHSIDASCTDLDPASRARLLELAVFAGGPSVPAAAAGALWAAAGLDDLDTEDLLIKLSQRSLIRFDPRTEMFSLHDLINDYLIFQLDEPELPRLHSRLAGCLLDEWGGLDHALPELRRRVAGGPLDLYGLRMLVRHLLAGAAEDDRLDRLLALEWPQPAGGVDNAWYIAHERLGLTAEYAADVRAAWQRAAAAEDIGLELRYALIVGSLSSAVANLPSDLVEGLVTAGIWAPLPALATVQAASNEAVRSDAIARLAPLLDGDAPQAAWTMALALTEPLPRAQALTALLDRFSGEALEQRFAELRATVEDIPDPQDRINGTFGIAQALRGRLFAELYRSTGDIEPSDIRAEFRIGLVPDLAEPLRSRALHEAWQDMVGTEDPYWRANALDVLAPVLDDEFVTEALSLARDTADPLSRAIMLAALAPRLGPDIAVECLAAAEQIRGDTYRQADVLSSVAGLLPEAALDQARRIAEGMYDRGARVQALLAIVDRLADGDRRVVLESAFEAAGRITNELFTRAETFGALAPRLHGPLQRRAVEEALWAAGRVSDGTSQARLLQTLFGLLPAEFDDALVEVVRSVRDSYDQASLLAQLGERTARPEQRRAFLLEGLAISRAVRCDPTAPAAALAVLSAGMEDRERLPVAERVLARFRAINYSEMKALALPEAARHLPPALYPQVLSIIGALQSTASRSLVLSRLAPDLPAGCWKEAVQLAENIVNPQHQIETLLAMMPYAPPEQLDAIMPLLGQPMSWDQYAYVIALLVERRPDDPDLIDSTLAELSQELPRLIVTDPAIVPSILRNLAPVLTPEGLSWVEGLIADVEPEPQLMMLTALAEAFPQERRTEEHRRLAAKAAALGSSLPMELALAQNFGDRAAVERVLRGTAPPETRAEFVQQVGGLVGQHRDLQELALDLAAELAVDPKVDLITMVAFALPEDLLDTAWRRADGIVLPAARATALRAVAQRALDLGTTGAWQTYGREALIASAEADRQTVLESIVALLPSMPGEVGAAPTALAALDDVERWWPASQNQYDWIPDDPPAERPVEQLFSGQTPAYGVPVRRHPVFLVPGIVDGPRETAWDGCVAMATATFTERLIHRYRSRRNIPMAARVEFLPERFLTAINWTIEMFAESAGDDWYEGRWVQAIDKLSVYLQLHPDDTERRSYRGQILGDLGYAALALKDLAETVTGTLEQLTFAYAQSARGYALGALGLMDEANETFGLSLSIAPGNAWTYFRRGLVRYSAADIDEAAADLGRSLEADDPPLTDLQAGKARHMLTRLRGR